jgi:hypothetical protein
MRDACLVDDDVTSHNRFSSFSPVFPVRDLRCALAHYASLGFEAEPYADGDGYGFAERDEVSLHLSLGEGHGPGAGHQHVGTAYLYVEDADALYDEWARPGVGGLTRRVGDTSYKLREGSHVAPDGNLIRFGSPMPGRPGERLRAHLETRYGITVDAMTELDLGVWRVGRAEGPDWVARWFPARRAAEAVAGDDAVRAAGGLSHLGALPGRPKGSSTRLRPGERRRDAGRHGPRRLDRIREPSPA